MKQFFPNERALNTAMQLVQDCLVISVQIELYDASLKQLRNDFLEKIKLSGVRKAIFDLSTVDLLDAYAYNSICDTANMAKVMGTQSLVTGIRPGVASALVELGVNVGQVETTLNLEDGIARLAELAVHADTAADEDPVSDMDETTLRAFFRKNEHFVDGDLADGVSVVPGKRVGE